MVDVPRKLVQHLARLLAAERRARGTRAGTWAATAEKILARVRWVHTAH